MEELKVYHRCSYSARDIAEELARLADAPEEAIQELDEAIFHIETYAQNEYNPDYFRILLNVLQTIADSSAMPF